MRGSSAQDIDKAWFAEDYAEDNVSRNPASGDVMRWIWNPIKITIFTAFRMNPASGDVMKWIRNPIKITIFTAFCMNPPSGDVMK